MSYTYKEFALGALIGSLAGAAATTYFLQTNVGRGLKNEILKNVYLPEWLQNGKTHKHASHVHAAAMRPVRKAKYLAKRATKKEKVG